MVEILPRQIVLCIRKTLKRLTNVRLTLIWTVSMRPNTTRIGRHPIFVSLFDKNVSRLYQLNEVNGLVLIKVNRKLIYCPKTHGKIVHRVIKFIQGLKVGI